MEAVSTILSGKLDGICGEKLFHGLSDLNKELKLFSYYSKCIPPARGTEGGVI